MIATTCSTWSNPPDEYLLEDRLMKTMKKSLLAAALMLGTFIGNAQAERYVLIHHGQGVDPFFPVIERGARDAAKSFSATIEVNFDPNGDMANMARLIESAAASKPDGMMITMPSVEALGPAVKAVTAAGIPVITFNSGISHYKKLGALLHVGQDEKIAGRAAGERAKSEGAIANNGKHLCVIKEPQNRELFDRCETYAAGIGQELNMIDASNDMIQAKARTAAALQADPKITAIHTIASDLCQAVHAAAAEEVGADVYISCNDVDEGAIKLVKEGKVKFLIDQQPYLQGYLPVTFLHLYNSNAGMLPGSAVSSGPFFITRENASQVEAKAGTTR